MRAHGRIEQLWANEKYEVMYHSQTHYNRIRNVMKSEATYGTVAALIESAKSVPPTQGSSMNAFDHMWGYFKNVCEAVEKEEYKKLKQEFLVGVADDAVMIAFLQHLSNKYQVRYLLESTLLQSKK